MGYGHAVSVDLVRPFGLYDFGLNIDTAAAALAPYFADMRPDMYDVRRAALAIVRRACSHAPEAALTAWYQNGGPVDALFADVPTPVAAEAAAAVAALRPTRRRAALRLHVTNNDTVKRVPLGGFSQRVYDLRAVERRFDEVPGAPEADPVFARITAGVVAMCREAGAGAGELDVVVHFVSLVARPGLPASNAPEGVHQDGCDYLVSALVLARINVTGGESRIRRDGPDGPFVYRETLEPGRGIFQTDRGSRLLHDVSPVEVVAGFDHGRRDILGFDVNRV